MRIETKEIKIFEFNELSESVKNEVIERLEERIVDNKFSFLKEDLEEYLYNVCNIKNFKIEYSFCYCQGDGCCFYGFNLLNYSNLKNKEDLNKFESYILNNYSTDEINLILEYLNSGYNFKLIKDSSRYSHKYTCIVDYEFYHNDNKELENKVNELIDKLSTTLECDVYYEICDEMEKIGYSYYDVDENDVKDYIECLGLEFLEDGEIYRE